MEGLSGLFAPVVSPFTDDGSTISEVRLARLVRHLSERQISGFVTTTDTGEFLALSFSERKTVLEIVLRESGGKPVLAHISTMNTSASLDLAQHAARHGARAVVVGPPFYGKYSDEEIAKFFETIAAYAGCPLLIVDPLQRLSDELLDRIESNPQTYRTQSLPQPTPFPTYSDSFQFGSMIVTPVALVKQSGDVAEIDRLIAEYGGKRICKAALEELGIEVGGLRSPAAIPPRDVISKIKSLIQIEG